MTSRSRVSVRAQRAAVLDVERERLELDRCARGSRGSVAGLANSPFRGAVEVVVVERNAGIAPDGPG